MDYIAADDPTAVREAIRRVLSNERSNMYPQPDGNYRARSVLRDPARPDGVQGRAALLEYLRKLLAVYPDWVWRADAVFPIDGGFTLRWKAEIPVKGTVIHETGLDLVLVENGLVTRNEVYFDRSALLGAIPDTGRHRGTPRDRLG